MNSNMSKHFHEVSLRLRYLLMSLFVCFFCSYYKSTQILYMIIRGSATPPLPGKTKDDKLQFYDDFFGNLFAKKESAYGLRKKVFLKQQIDLPLEKGANQSLNLTKPGITSLSCQALPSRGWQGIDEYDTANNTVVNPMAPLPTSGSPSQPCLARQSSKGCFVEDKENVVMSYDFIYTNVTEAFYGTLQSVIVCTILFCLPFFIYELWCFLMPSRYYTERISFNKAILISLGYAFSAVFLTVFLLLPQICQFFHLFAVFEDKLHITNQARIGPYLTWVFTTQLTLVAVPACILLCVQANAFNIRLLLEKRKITYYQLLILAALISPPDPLSQIFISFCLFVFSESVLWFLLYKKNTKNF